MSDNVIPLRRTTAAASLGEVTAAVVPITSSVSFAALKKGDTNAVVAGLQRNLIRWGFHTGDPEGTFEEQTHQAVLALQMKLSLPVSGVFDELTAMTVREQLADHCSVLRRNMETVAAADPVDTDGSVKLKMMSSKPTAPQAPAVNDTRTAKWPWILVGLGALVIVGAAVANNPDEKNRPLAASPDNFLDENEEPAGEIQQNE